MTFSLLQLAEELGLPDGWVIETSMTNDEIVIKQRNSDWEIKVSRQEIEDAGTLSAVKAMVRERIARYDQEHGP